MDRWLRERARSPLISRLKVGSTIHRNYKGQDVFVKVKEGHYQYNLRDYPTLYSVVKDVVGAKEASNGRKLVNWSATRFFAHCLDLVRPC
jgi:hypothetical protein